MDVARARRAGAALEGRLLTGAVRDDTVSLVLDEETVTPPGLQVAAVVEVGDTVTFTGTQEPMEMHAWRLDPGDGVITRLTHAAGVHGVVAGGDLTVVVSETADAPLPVAVLRKGDEPIHPFASFAETPSLTASPTFVSLGRSDLRTAIFTPGGAEPDEPLPVLLDPYGGPHFAVVQKVLTLQLESQWFADQGFAVLVVDGRGTPGRGPGWDREVYRNLADPVLEDQVEACTPRRSGIRSSISRGWRSAAGRSAGSSRRWPCCAGPTSSTRR